MLGEGPVGEEAYALCEGGLEEATVRGVAESLGGKGLAEGEEGGCWSANSQLV